MTTSMRRAAVLIAIVAAILIPGGLSGFLQSRAADALIAGVLVLSLVLIAGFVGQTSFCQFSFAAIGAFTVGSLVGGHHWSFWLALPVGVVFAGLVGVLVGIPALRLSGLFLAILTVAVALLFDRFILAPGTWDSFSGGVQPWRVSRPVFLGLHLDGPYSFYLAMLIVFLGAALLVWNLRIGKTGRVLRSIRESEVAARTMGIDVTAWKLAAFGVSAALAGLAGGLTAIAVGSVSPPSYDFMHSVTLAAMATVMGVESLASAAAGGIFLIFVPELLSHTPLSPRYFPLILGGSLIAQLLFTPEGVITKTQGDIRRMLKRTAARPAPAEVA
jgi:branched-chain amino acid transport system permease protein